MGEMADYMINGDDCQICGAYMGEGDGYPRTCAGCDEGPEAIAAPATLPKLGKHIPCPDPTNGCERKFRNRHAAAMHWIDKHG